MLRRMKKKKPLLDRRHCPNQKQKSGVVVFFSFSSFYSIVVALFSPPKNIVGDHDQYQFECKWLVLVATILHSGLKLTNF